MRDLVDHSSQHDELVQRGLPMVSWRSSQQVVSVAAMNVGKTGRDEDRAGPARVTKESPLHCFT